MLMISLSESYGEIWGIGKQVSGNQAAQLIQVDVHNSLHLHSFLLTDLV
jgi:hypothetical protein